MNSLVACRRLVARTKPGRQRFQLRQTRPESSGSPKASTQPTPNAPNPSSPIKYAKTSAGSGDPEGLSAAGGGSTGFSMRGPVTWPALGLVAVAAASAVAYYKIERERRLENAMGKIVSSELGWSPNPELLARRQYVRTKWGWFPKEDAFGGGECPRGYSLSLCVPLVLCVTSYRELRGRQTVLHLIQLTRNLTLQSGEACSRRPLVPGRSRWQSGYEQEFRREVDASVLRLRKVS